ncbi:MAG: hypothetical protein ACOCP8_04375 [archaeon]
MINLKEKLDSYHSDDFGHRTNPHFDEVIDKVIDDIKEAVYDYLNYKKANHYEDYNLTFEEAVKIINKLSKKYNIPDCFGHWSDDQVIYKIFGDFRNFKSANGNEQSGNKNLMRR